ncbi:MAG TPA: PQQ-dependent dehydrogenase, methanol/ethanol family [Bryobacteraceae bacterium]|nr:PQQ-dependent dehydrogenase, methanol/ethanol family [Bryobacteraceae bacterium]
MFKSQRTWVVILMGVIAGVGSVTMIRAQADHAASRPVDDTVLKSVGTAADAYPGSWLSYGRTQSETRYSPLKQIDTSNVNRLGLAWSYVVGAGGGNQEGTPLVWNNTLYGITSWSVVFAVDAQTGKQIWRWDPEVNQPAVRPKICCGIVNRGLALYNGTIIAPVTDGRLTALDALTGKPVWETRVAYPQDLYTITMAPRIAGGKVIVGISGGDKPTRGFVDAYDAKTGVRAWRFYTVPGDPAKPYENEAMRAAAKTWGGDFYKNGGGGAVWDGVAYDPETGLVYVGTGNAEPWVQKFRGAKNVDNLYTCSILAIDLKTGLLKWHYQTVPNDNWDFDSVQQLMILNLTIKGRQRKVITQAAKNGFFYVLDRGTGEFISGAPFVKVTWATGFDERGRPMVSPEAYYDTEGVEIYPTGGAHNWSPMSFNPTTGLVYIPASYMPFRYQATEELKPGSNGYVRPTGDIRSIKASIGPNAPEGVRGGLQAWDPVSQKLIWQGSGGGGIGGGSVTTGGNLVFHVSNDGSFRAYSADKGEKLFEVQTGRTGMAPPITYEAGGKQYVAFLGGLGRPANVSGPNDAAVDHPPMLFVFELDGKAQLPKPAPPPTPRNATPGPAPEQAAN